jgi:hypothetical protein
VAEIIDLNAIRRLMEESDQSDRHVMMHHILMEALMKMKEINATKADIIYVLRHTLDILERRGK